MGVKEKQLGTGKYEGGEGGRRRREKEGKGQGKGKKKNGEEERGGEEGSKKKEGRRRKKNHLRFIAAKEFIIFCRGNGELLYFNILKEGEGEGKGKEKQSHIGLCLLSHCVFQRRKRCEPRREWY